MPWKGLGFIRCGADERTKVHEHVHASEQKWFTLGWQWKYLTDSMFRMKAEVRAFKAEAKFMGTTVGWFYSTIKDEYRLSQEAKDAIVSYMMELK